MPANSFERFSNAFPMPDASHRNLPCRPTAHITQSARFVLAESVGENVLLDTRRNIGPRGTEDAKAGEAWSHEDASQQEARKVRGLLFYCALRASSFKAEVSSAGAVTVAQRSAILFPSKRHSTKP